MKFYLAHVGIVAALSTALYSCGENATEETVITDTAVIDSQVVSTTTATTTTENYIDLGTGENITKNEAGKYTTSSGRMVVFYIDPVKKDTFYAPSGELVNTKLTNLGKGTWQFADKKVKIDEDDIKIEYADGTKVKIEEDEMKIKRPDGSKTKIEEDEYKHKTKDQKVKIEDGEVKVKEK